MAFAWVAWCATAFASPHVDLDAVVDPGLRVVRGTLKVSDLDDATWVDALIDLPIPDDPTDVARTFPGRPNRGGVSFQRTGDVIAFEAVLPDRWSDLGSSRHGLFANGAWYPIPLVDGRLPTVTWDVKLTLPDGVVGALGNVTGEGTLRWTGDAERVSLAAIPNGVLTSLGGGDWSTTLLTPRKPRRGLVRAFNRALPLARVDGRTWSGVAVEAPLRRDLARPGAQLAYVSDRLGRVFPWFVHLHDRPLVQGVVTSWQGAPDPLTRDVAGAAMASVAGARERRRLSVNWLGILKWIPAVDTALYNRDMAFQDELLHRVVPTDGLGDDLAARFAPAVSGTWVTAQVGDEAGPDAVPRLADALALGWTLRRALDHVGFDGVRVNAWGVAYPAQDWTLDRRPDSVVVTRAAPADAPPEAIVLSVDGAPRQLLAPRGEARFELPLDPGLHRLRLDPQRHVGQTSREGDVRPIPVRWTLNGQISAINAAEGTASAFAVLTARGQADTHNRFRLWAITNSRSWLEGRFGWTHYLGPLTRPTERAHSLTLGAEGAWLNANFADANGAHASVGGVLAWAYDTHDTSLFPTRGIRTTAAVYAGGLPETHASYVRTVAEAAGAISLAPRFVLAARVAGGWAHSDLPHERLAFGGDTGVRAFPDDAVQTTTQVVTNLELRTAPMRQGSWPLGVLYVRDLHLIGGVDVGVGDAQSVPVAAVGAAFGLGVVVDNLGIAPGAALLTIGVPLWHEGFDMPAHAPPVTVSVTWGPVF